MTMMEVLSVTAILALLSALLYPVIREQIGRAKVAQCVGKLRQVHTALMLYRENQSGTVPYGFSDEMGLPTPAMTTLIRGGYLSRQDTVCSLGYYPGPGKTGVFNLFWSPREFGAAALPWLSYVQSRKEKAVLVMDMNHDPASSFYSAYEQHLGIGVYLDGHVSVLRKPGLMHQPTWWDDFGGDE
jgi:type II secretory pathway pseudopilin PulG